VQIHSHEETDDTIVTSQAPCPCGKWTEGSKDSICGLNAATLGRSFVKTVIIINRWNSTVSLRPSCPHAKLILLEFNQSLISQQRLETCKHR
jgi:hypothetical protein